jgi:hypothetical protein
LIFVSKERDCCKNSLVADPLGSQLAEAFTFGQQRGSSHAADLSVASRRMISVSSTTSAQYNVARDIEPSHQQRFSLAAASTRAITGIPQATDPDVGRALSDGGADGEMVVEIACACAKQRFGLAFTHDHQMVNQSFREERLSHKRSSQRYYPESTD